MQTRRDVLAVAAATVSLPMIDSALGALRSAHAAAPAAPAATPAAPAAAAATPPAQGATPEKAGWFTSKLKPADVKANEFTAIEDKKVVLANVDKKITATTNICSHRQCPIKPVAGTKTLDCLCHRSSFNLDGSVAKGPATKALDHYAIRVSSAGFIEVDPGQIVEKDAKEFAITVA